MFNLPFFRFPYYNYNPYYSKFIQNNKKSLNDSTSNLNTSEMKQIEENEEKDNKLHRKNEKEKRSYKYNSFGPFNFINPLSDDIQEDEPILEILGLQLYLDDLIILGLLFFLYKEKVQDEMLFISLLLLLIT